MAWLRGLVMDMAMAMGRVWLWLGLARVCLLYTSDAADDWLVV